MHSSIRPQLAAGIASSLLRTHSKTGSLKEFYKSYQQWLKLIEQHPSLSAVLVNPLISQLEKREVILDISKKENLTNSFSSFLDILNESCLLSLSYDIGKVFHHLYDSQEGIILLKAQTPVSLNSATTSLLAQSIEKWLGKKVNITQEVDPHRLGGLTLLWDNKKLDFSLSAYLQQIKHVMKGSIQ